MAKNKSDAKGKTKGDKKAKKGKGGADGISVAAHPRAAAQVRRAKGFGGVTFELPAKRLGRDHRALDHLAHLGVALGGGDVPGERHQVAPVTVIVEQHRGTIGVAASECGIECSQPFRYLPGWRRLAHRQSPAWVGLAICRTWASDTHSLASSREDLKCRVVGRSARTFSPAHKS